MKPIVSIIIPCYNQGEYLGYALKSLQSQTMQAWECIIVNDGSTDNTEAVAASFMDKDKRITLLRQPNSGSAVARNKGLSVAQGQFLQFLDADDMLDNDKLRRQTEYMSTNNVDVSYTRNAYFHSTAEPNTYDLQSKWQQTYLCSMRTALLGRWGVDFSIPLHCFMYRMDFLRSNHLQYDEHIRQREDWKFHLDVSRACHKPKTMLDYMGAYYRINPTSKTSSYTKMAKGNMQLLHFIRPQIRFWEYPLLAYRLSSEMVQIGIHALRYRTREELRFIRPFFRSAGDVAVLLMALILSPVTVFMNIIRRMV